jgi:hypothetical protein
LPLMFILWYSQSILSFKCTDQYVCRLYVYSLFPAWLSLMHSYYLKVKKITSNDWILWFDIFISEYYISFEYARFYGEYCFIIGFSHVYFDAY